MTVYHIVLIRLRPTTTAAQASAWEKLIKAMVGQVPGLQRVEVGPPHASTAHRSKGFNLGLVAVLDDADSIKVYAEHPAHLE
ncbi:hypothetical protein DV737_g4409, partial [Chaetothyriales sp. CBS 132003]